MKITGILTLLLLTAQVALAGNGELNGRITQTTTGEPIVGAYVTVEIDSKGIYRTVTDVNGYYVIKPIENGTYDLRISSTGFTGQLIKGISFVDGQTRIMNVALNDLMLEGVIVYDVKHPKDLVTPGTTGNVAIITYKELEKIPLAPLDAIAITSNVYQEDYGDPIQFRGARPEGTLYIIDGVKIMGEPGVVRNSIEDMAIYSGGIPAKYGDATGGIVVITTKSYKKLR